MDHCKECGDALLNPDVDLCPLCGGQTLAQRAQALISEAVRNGWMTDPAKRPVSQPSPIVTPSRYKKAPQRTGRFGYGSGRVF